jgi:V/A-type H+-transporting ATPase subunit F
MSQEIGVVGSPDFTTGFRLAGVRRFENVPDEEKDDRLDEAVTELFDDLDHLSRTVRRNVETSVEPVLVTLGGDSSGGALREQIKRAIGIDLMEE